MVGNASPSPETVEGLFAFAGKGTKILVTEFATTGRAVVLEYQEHPMQLSQPLMDLLRKLRKRSCGRWLTMARESTSADDPFKNASKIRISRAFEISGENFKDWSSRLAFVYIVQGVNEMEKCKIVVSDNVHSAAAGMIHEAMNGFSITLSGLFTVKASIWLWNSVNTDTHAPTSRFKHGKQQ